MNQTNRVLIVEDEVIIALDLKFSLEADGFEIIGPVGTVAQALARLSQGDRPDAAILDLNLGRERSDAVATALNELNVPIIVISADGQLPVDEAFGKAMMIRKPVQTGEISQQLKRVLSVPSARS